MFKCKKCRCSFFSAVLKFFLKLFGIVALLFAGIFAIFFFDLDGKLLFYVVEPFLKKHYDNMERIDTLQSTYDIDKPHYEYDV